jgi:hypothetical protein
VTGRSGVALAAALLILSAIATLALGTVLVVQLDLMLAANRQALALERADSRSRLTLLLLRLEADSQGGELPAEAPAMGGVRSYLREGPTTAVVSVEAGRRPGGYRSDARIELRWTDGAWRIHVAQVR